MTKKNESKPMSSFGAYGRRTVMYGDSMTRGVDRMIQGAATRAACIRSRTDSAVEETGRKIGDFFGKFGK